MPYYTPSTPAIKRSHPVPESARTLVYLSCGDTMHHSRTIPKLGVRSEQLIFVCPSCKAIDTKEVKAANSPQPIRAAAQLDHIALPSLAFQEP